MSARRVRMSALVVLATVSLIGLRALGSGELATPPLGSWDTAVEWYDRVGPATAVVVALRLLTMAGVAWLLLAAALQLIATISLRDGVQRMADALSPLVLRRLAHGVASLSVTTGLVAPVVDPAPAGEPPGTAVMQVLDDDDSEEPSTVPPSTAPPTTVPVTTVPAPVPEHAAPPPVLPDEVAVEPGGSFWTLAAQVVGQGQGSEPSDREVFRYWQRLIEANRDRLVDPANPDLLFPGQILVLPRLDTG